jgi:hypothetical protein
MHPERRITSKKRVLRSDAMIAYRSGAKGRPKLKTTQACEGAKSKLSSFFNFFRWALLRNRKINTIKCSLIKIKIIKNGPTISAFG